jgi:retron-type reverse transcriptase
MEKFAKIFLITMVLLAIFIVAAIITPTNHKQISVRKYGDKYPFNIDNLTLYCENAAVWVIDKQNNIYPLNAAGYDKFKNHAGTDKILNFNTQNPQWQNLDLIINDGLKLCKGK